jgi:hypothetical protein
VENIIINNEIKHKIICLIGTLPEAGRKLISLNLAIQAANLRYNVIFGSSMKEKIDNIPIINSFNNRETVQIEEKLTDEIFLLPTRITGLRILSFTEIITGMTSTQIENRLADLPEKITRSSDYFIFSADDTSDFLNRSILSNAGIIILVANLGATVYADIYKSIESLLSLPGLPDSLYITFNNTHDLNRAYETYSEVLNHFQQFNMNIKLYFLGIIPPDPIRMKLFSKDVSIPPVTYFFPESPFSGSIGFILDKINIRKSRERVSSSNVLIQSDQVY